MRLDAKKRDISEGEERITAHSTANKEFYARRVYPDDLVESSDGTMQLPRVHLASVGGDDTQVNVHLTVVSGQLPIVPTDATIKFREYHSYPHGELITLDDMPVAWTSQHYVVRESCGLDRGKIVRISGRRNHEFMYMRVCNVRERQDMWGNRVLCAGQRHIPFCLLKYTPEYSSYTAQQFLHDAGIACIASVCDDGEPTESAGSDASYVAPYQQDQVPADIWISEETQFVCLLYDRTCGDPAHYAWSYRLIVREDDVDRATEVLRVAGKLESLIDPVPVRVIGGGDE